MSESKCPYCLVDGKAIESELTALRQLLATERDAFGKKETELRAEAANYEERLLGARRAIENLLAEHDRYREALKSIRKCKTDPNCPECQRIAKAALGEKK